MTSTLAIMIAPGAETAYVMRVNGNAEGELSRILGGSIEAVEVTGGVMWINGEGKVDGRLLHQCADCDGWLYASETDLVGRLRCAQCGYIPSA